MVPADEQTQADAPPAAAPPETPAETGKGPQPDGAFARFQTADGSSEAWLRTDEGDDPVGYLRDNSATPARTVRYTNPAHWATDVDQRGMEQVGQEQGQDDSVSEVTEALQALADGERNIDDVVQFFRGREWPRRADGADGEHEPGSFAEVANAYSSGVIDHDQYVQLAQAATEAMQEQSGMGDQQ